MSDTVTVIRKPGAPRTMRVSSGAHEFEFEGDGPFEVPVETWRAIASAASESLALSDESTPRRRRTSTPDGDGA